MANTYSTVFITLASGTQFAVTEIKLYCEADLNKAVSLKAQAMQKMGGWNSGIGFWGSLDWVLIGSAVMGAIESKVSQNMFREGAQLMSSAASQFDTARWTGKYFRIQEIVYLDSGTPEKWRTVSVPRFILNGDRFIGCKEKTGKEVLIALDMIEEMHFG